MIAKCHANCWPWHSRGLPGSRLRETGRLPCKCSRRRWARGSRSTWSVRSDDCEMSRELLAMAFEGLARVEAAGDGEAAVQMFEAALGKGEPFDLGCPIG